MNKPVRQFCTYFDHRYLSRGLALYQSLQQHAYPFCLWVLCLDKDCYRILEKLNLDGMRLIALEDFEGDNPELLHAKQSRSLPEYYFTCTPSLPLYVFRHSLAVDLVTYLDADIFFASDPAPLFDEIAGHSVAIIPHAFPPPLRHLESAGKYNVGWLSFRRDDQGLACLRWWRDRCLEWCYDRYEEGRFADQKYLDDWPERFRNVVVLRHKGANLAPWNLSGYQVLRDGHNIRIDGELLIFYHFHGLKQLYGPLYDPNLANYGVKPSGTIMKGIYTPYIRTLLAITEMVCLDYPDERVSQDASIKYRRGNSAHCAPLSRRRIRHRAIRKLKDFADSLIKIASGQILVVRDGVDGNLFANYRGVTAIGDGPAADHRSAANV